MADVKWIKICTDIFDDEKMLIIDAKPKADSIIVVWFKLLAMAGKQNNGGVFMVNEKFPHTEDTLAAVLHRPKALIKLSLETFESLGMVDRSDGVIKITNWEKHQSSEKLAEMREKNRQKVAAYRERMKQDCNGTTNDCNQPCNGYVTVTGDSCNRSVTPLDKDIDKEEDIFKNERKKEEINNISNLVCARTREDFAAMTDDELLNWREERSKLPFEPTAENFALEDERTELHLAECKRRGLVRSFVGKPTMDESGNVKRMESYEEIIDRHFPDSPLLKGKIFDFVKHCQVNGKKVINARLEDLCAELSEYNTTADRIEALDEAINKGYYDIRRF